VWNPPLGTHSFRGTAISSPRYHARPAFCWFYFHHRCSYCWEKLRPFFIPRGIITHDCLHHCGSPRLWPQTSLWAVWFLVPQSPLVVSFDPQLPRESALTPDVLKNCRPSVRLLLPQGATRRHRASILPKLRPSRSGACPQKEGPLPKARKIPSTGQHDTIWENPRVSRTPPPITPQLTGAGETNKPALFQRPATPSSHPERV